MRVWGAARTPAAGSPAPDLCLQRNGSIILIPAFLCSGVLSGLRLELVSIIQIDLHGQRYFVESSWKVQADPAEVTGNGAVPQHQSQNIFSPSLQQ